MKSQDPIARGRTAEVFAFAGDRVLKLYEPGYSQEVARRELSALRWAARQGVSVPQPGRVVVRRARVGITMARIEGQNGMERIMSDVGRAPIEAEENARLQVAVNSLSGGRLPDRRALLRARIATVGELPAPEASALSNILDSLPDGDRLLHGDFHPGNVIWSPNGPVVIDWVDASGGVPAADVARSLVLFGAHEPSTERDDPRRAFTVRYLAAYRDRSGDALDRLDDWVLVTAAARLAENAATDDDPLREFVHEHCVAWLSRR